jgi:hypothetical protein
MCDELSKERVSLAIHGLLMNVSTLITSTLMEYVRFVCMFSCSFCYCYIVRLVLVKKVSVVVVVACFVSRKSTFLGKVLLY